MRAEAGVTSNRISTSAEVDVFLAELSGCTSASSAGRLIFALDATASRQPTWDTACQLQADMFRETAAIGGLSLQLVYYRGLTECRASRWISQPGQLTGLMERILCRGGPTQIGKVLTHVKRETGILKVNALVFVGDAMEENPDILIRDAAELGRLGVPAFVFQEGANPSVEQVFRQIASLSHGAYCRFDAGAAKQLGELLKAVALFAVGGVAALEGRNDAGSVRLIGQLK
jgi:hypothetical protein